MDHITPLMLSSKTNEESVFILPHHRYGYWIIEMTGKCGVNGFKTVQAICITSSTTDLERIGDFLVNTNAINADRLIIKVSYTDSRSWKECLKLRFLCLGKNSL